MIQQRAMVMEGSLEEFDLVSVVQTVSIGRQATGVELRDERGTVVGTLLLKAGQIVSANAEGLSGLDAVRRLLKTAKLRRFYVYRAPGVEFMDRVGPVTQVLAQILSQANAPEAPPILMQGSLGDHDMRTIAEAVSLGRQAVGIEVFAPDGRRVGALYLKGGMILFAAWGRSAGEPALAELFKPRKDARFVVFRSPETRVGEPLARLRDVLQPSGAGPAVPAPKRVPGRDSVIVDIDEGGEDTEVTRVSAPPSAPAPSRPPSQPVRATSQPAARKTVPPPPAPSARMSTLPPSRTSAPPPSRMSTPPAAPPSRPASQPIKPVAAPVAATPTQATPGSAPVEAKPVATRPSQPVAPPSEAKPVSQPVPVEARPSEAPTGGSPAATPNRSFPPPAAEPSHPVSQAPAAPRFRHSDHAPSEAGTILLDEDFTRTRLPTSVPPRRTPIVCITSPRGGVGRTTVALNLAVSLARRGRRVTVVDADANGLLPALNAGNRYAGVADVLEGRAALGEALLETRIAGLKILPSGDLSDDTYRHEGWRTVLGTLADQCDLVLVDCAPVYYGATLTALSCATHQLTVAAAEPSARRLCNAFQARLLQTVKAPPRALGIVINMLDYQASASLRALEELCTGEHAHLVFDTTIPRSPAFMEASARGLPIVHADRGASPTIAWVFETLATAMLERLELEVPSFASPLLA